MKRTGIRHQIPMSAMSRVLVLSAVVMLALACLADVAHAVGADANGCPQAKLDNQRSPAPFVDAAVLPDRVEPPDPAMPVGVVLADGSLTAPPVFARRAASRAPPIA
jgi:hypothetical protein